MTSNNLNDDRPCPYSDRRLRYKTMRLSVIEGLFATIAMGLQQIFYIPYLNAMGASNLQIGIGASIPALMTGLILLFVPSLLRRWLTYRGFPNAKCCERCHSSWVREGTGW